MSEQATHTPGPWVVDWVVDGAFQISGTADGDTVVIASRAPLQKRHFEFADNAHLIAAAPDYHAGVREALQPNDGYNCEYVSIPVKAWRMILAAHAKAEGR